MNITQQAAIFDYCCVCTDIINLGEGDYTCFLCAKSYHATCLTNRDNTLTVDSWNCNECVKKTHHANEKLNLQSKILNIGKLHKLNTLISTDNDDLKKPLLNNKDLDCDINYYADLVKDCEYLAPSQALNRFHTDQPSLTILHLNTRSIISKLNEVQNLLQQLPTSILAVTETWLTDNTADTIHIPGYTFTYRNRGEGRGGGVGLFTREDIKHKEMIIPTSFTSFESLFINISSTKSTDIVVGVIYRPPGTNLDFFNTEFESLIDLLIVYKNRNKRIFLAGDFNIDLLASETHIPTADFTDCLTSHHFLPLILQPTRITTTTATLIDNIFTNSPASVTNSAIIISDISDHLPIITWIENTSKPLNKLGNPQLVRTVNDNTISNFRLLLDKLDWSPVLSLCSKNESNLAYALFIKLIQFNYDQAFPLRPRGTTKRKSAQNPWMTQGLLNSTKKKEKLYVTFVKNPTPANKARFTAYRNKYKVIRTKLEQDYYSNEFAKYNHDIKKTWQLIKSIVNTENKDTIIKEILINGKKIEDSELIADIFNTHFTNLPKSLAQNIPLSKKSYQDYMPASSMNSFAMLPTSSYEIIAINKTLKDTHSTGPDDLNPHILSPLMDLLATPLSEIINCSIRTGDVPSDIKLAKVIPIHKQGNKNEVSNFRPISILPFFSKLFERVMYDRLYSFISQSKILYPFQHGFQPGHSTYMSLLDIQDKISQAMDNNEYSIGIFLDLAKAFDTVDHKILLHKLETYGIRGVALAWLSSYLTNRRQQVSCNGKLSSFQNIVFGVPQGSILGPLLFLIYINDLPNSATFLHYILFADDSNAFYSHSSYDQLIKIVNNDLELANDWFKANKLSLNLSKTNYIIFRSNKKLVPTLDNPLRIENKLIPQVSSSKFLGIHIDQHLKWDIHIAEIAKKISKNTGIIRRISYLLPTHILKNLYFTLIHPYLNYCNLIWTSTYDTHLLKLNILQKKAIRIITKSPINTHTASLYSQLNLLKISQIKFVQTSIFMYQYANNLLPQAFASYFKPNLLDRAIRNNRVYISIFARTNTRKFSIKHQGPLIWNSIPECVRVAMSLASFKIQIRAHTIVYVK